MKHKNQVYQVPESTKSQYTLVADERCCLTLHNQSETRTLCYFSLHTVFLYVTVTP